MSPINRNELDPDAIRQIKDIEMEIAEEYETNEEIDRKKVAELRKRQIYAGFGLGLPPTMLRQQRF